MNERYDYTEIITKVAKEYIEKEKELSEQLENKYITEEEYDSSVNDLKIEYFGGLWWNLEIF